VNVLVVAKTRMTQNRMCLGAHDLETFRSLRLFRHDGSYLERDAPIEIGDVLDLQYEPRSNLHPPHVEDVLVAQGPARRVGRREEIATLVLERDVVWRSVAELFDGLLCFTASGSAYIPVDGPQPGRSTGYWLPDRELHRRTYNHRIRYGYGAAGLNSMPYVGVDEGPETIPARSLLRLSLSRPNQPPNQPNACWLQLSGWFAIDG
jgi:hypothetical protein